MLPHSLITSNYYWCFEHGEKEKHKDNEPYFYPLIITKMYYIALSLSGLNEHCHIACNVNKAAAFRFKKIVITM